MNLMVACKLLPFRARRVWSQGLIGQAVSMILFP